jgi:hypothetical protein
MMMDVEQSVEWDLAGETEVLGENLPQYHFVQSRCLSISGGKASGATANISVSAATT